AMFRLLGLPPGATPANPLQPHPGDLGQVRQAVRAAVREEGPIELSYRVVLPDGTVKHVKVLGRPVHTQNGLEYQGVLMDVTEGKRAELAVEKAQAELARVTRLSAMAEVAAAIAHEISQPLAAIVNNSSVCLRLLEGTHLGAREAVHDIVAEAQRAGAI